MGLGIFPALAQIGQALCLETLGDFFFIALAGHVESEAMTFRAKSSLILVIGIVKLFVESAIVNPWRFNYILYMKYQTSLAIFGFIAICWGLSLGGANAQVAIDNNLSSVLIGSGSMTTSGSSASTSFDVSANAMYAVTSTIQSTATGINISPYYAAGISSAVPTSASSLSANLKLGSTGGAAYAATANNMIFTTATNQTKAYYSLGLGRFDAFGSAGYNWQATGMTLYNAKGVNGNIVANAGFENTSVTFFTTTSGTNGGSYVTNAGGNSVWQINSTTNSFISIAVVIGQEYTYDFWYAAPTIGNGAKIEYGANALGSAMTIAAGNSGKDLYLGGGNVAWTEVSGTFVATSDTWYLGGMSNGGALQLDDIYVAAVPEPSTVLLTALGIVLLVVGWRRTLPASKGG